MPRPKISHPWPDNYKDAVALQEKLKGKAVHGGDVSPLRLVAGADVSYKKGDDKYFAAVVVMTYPGMEVVEESYAEGKADFPYIPGLLTFREGPIMLQAFAKLASKPDLVMFDGQGIAHPRGFGVASHMGVLLGIPSIGCAKSVLVGEYREPGRVRGSSSPMLYKGSVVGRALRTRDGVKPGYVSIGNMVSLDFACRLVLECAKGYRLPEPTRRAHILVNKKRTLAAPRQMRDSDLPDIYRTLLAHYGPQHWWPGETPFEVMVGAILTQNTAWTNVEKAIINLKAAKALSAKAIYAMPEAGLAGLIRPSGYFNIKAKRLKAFIAYFVEKYGGSVERMKKAPCGTLRDELFAVKGVGPETADSILLYALGCRTFVVDAYTKRIFSRHGFFPEDSPYEFVRRFFMERLPEDAALYNEYHALIVKLAKDLCTKKSAKCGVCPLFANNSR